MVRSASDLTPLTFRRLCQARDLLAELREGAVPVSAVARLCQLSPTQLIRGFGAVFGATPHQFRTQLRIERAKALLAHEHMSVTAVCFDVGFTSLGSFSELFARRVGSSPSAYRSRLRRLYPVPEALRRALAPDCFSAMALLPPGAFRNFREAGPTASVIGHAHS